MFTAFAKKAVHISFDQGEPNVKKSSMKSLNTLCFGTSVFFLAAAAVCGILRKWYEIELPFIIIRWILPIITSAAVGYLTNWMAIQLLFRPYRPVKWLWNLQGMIPKEQAVLAETLAKEIPENLIPTNRIAFHIRRNIREYMKDEQLQSKILEYLQNENLKKELPPQAASFLLFFLKEKYIWNILIKKPIWYARVFLQIQISRNREKIVNGLDLPGNIRKSILDLNPKDIHILVERVTGEELGMLQLLGFVLGGLAGLLLVFAQ